MIHYIVFGTAGQFTVHADTWVYAVQSAIAVTDSASCDWTAHKLSDYNPTLRARLIRESVAL